jgi:hypothetical protein
MFLDFKGGGGEEHEGWKHCHSEVLYDSVTVYHKDNLVKEEGVFMHLAFTVNLRKAFEISVMTTVGKG